MRTIALLVLMFTAFPVQAQTVGFLKEVAPILQEYCFACHDARRKNGKYEMTTYEKLMVGGTNGEAIVPGKPLESDFHDLIVTDAARRMPPRDKGEAVPAVKAAIVAKWIEQGAKLDAGIDPKADLVRELRLRRIPPPAPESYRFPAAVTALAFTPDGKSLVAAGHQELTVWSLDGKLEKRLRTRTERAYSIALLPDGLIAVAGGRPGQEGDVRIYDLQAKGTKVGDVTLLDGVNDNAILVAQLADSDDSILCLAISTDGKFMASGGCDRIVRLWDISAGPKKAKLLRTIENHADWVQGIAFSNDGKFLATAARDKTAKVWDLTLNESILTHPDHQQPVNAVAFSPDGSLGWSVGADRKLRSWKPSGEGKTEKAYDGHTDEILKLVVHTKTAVAVTASADKTVRLWDLTKKQPLHALAGLNDFAFSVAVSPDGATIAAGSFDGDVQLWNAKDGKPIRRFAVSPGMKK